MRLPDLPDLPTDSPQAADARPAVPLPPPPGRLPAVGRFQRATRWWTENLDQYGGGYYGFVALITFTVLEIRGLWTAFHTYDSVRAFLEQEGWESLYGFGAESIQNFVSAMTWPWHAWEMLGLHAVWMAGVVWLIYRVSANALANRTTVPERDSDESRAS